MTNPQSQPKPPEGIMLQPTGAAVCLSQKEREVIALLGLPDKLIADKLHMSENTVKAHQRNIRLKLGITNKTEMAILATKQGYI